MLIAPTSKIILLKNPIEIDYLNELTFSNATAQYNYFHGLTKLECDNATYVRKDEVVRFPTDPSLNGVTYDDLIQYNYCMYQNDKWSNKWFYAFVRSVTFDNPGMCYIELETDVWQTWMFDITFKKSFVEREHVNSDEYGEHTIPEGLETGEYITPYGFDVSAIGTCHIVMGTTVSPIDGDTAVTGGTYGGIYSGVRYYVFESTTDLNNALNRIADNGNSASIVSLFYCPDWITGYSTGSFDSNGIKEVQNSVNVNQGSGIAIPLHPTAIDGYTCKNRKMFTYPYVGYLVSNNAGENITYHIEDFYYNESEVEAENYTAGELQVFGSCCPGASIRLIPKYYKVKDITLAPTYNNEYGLTGGKFPIASWGNDAYTNWLTQNAVNVGLNAAGSTISVAASVATGNPIGIASGVLGIANTLGQFYEHSFNTMQACGNVNSGDVTYGMGKLTFSGYFMTIKREYAKIIDDYFTMYGYKVNTLKTPNITGRTYWNYVKTIGCNIVGDIPQQDIEKIKDIFNNGVTLWHDPTKFLDYSQNNAIVSS